MGAGIWFIFMVFVMMGVQFYAEGANDIAEKMSAYDEANFKYKRVCRGLVVAAILGLIALPICMFFLT